MVIVVLADFREIDLDFDIVLFQSSFRAHAGKHEELRRPVSAGGEENLASVDLSTISETNTGSSPVLVDENGCHDGVCEYCDSVQAVD